AQRMVRVRIRASPLVAVAATTPRRNRRFGRRKAQTRCITTGTVSFSARRKRNLDAGASRWDRHFATPRDRRGAAYDALPTIGRIVDSRELSFWDSLEIRLHCAEIHLSVFANQAHWGGPCVLTLGDVEVAGQREDGPT